ncbi:thioesterase family protein [Cellulophaga baltica]|uniref:acyl-CoA thioesterase n=1 Tax=Cellulophaga TaxID=104264 RepID=UPI001C07CD4F|nr:MULTISPECIES: acyl-CoA thioesterase [Cellulophaga]MBU2995708.1 thioesterase family protein [Cellulophaga baltica]MDO6767102.1 acyl-CoA thioesterase [Cellulophaga sp. 1_MG-2023]
MYLKEFEIRWSDVDANRHLANSAYLNFMSHTRMSFLMENGFSHKTMAAHNLGPVVFHEHVYYFKEAFPGKPIRVSMEIMGMSEDYKFFEFHHNFYDYKGRHIAHCEMMGAWIDLNTRKLVGVSDEFLETFKNIEKAEGYKVLTKEDTRKFAKIPKDLA